MHIAIIVWAAASLLVGRLLHLFFSALFSPLRSIPGPFAARFGDLWYLWRVKKGHFEIDNIEMHRRYGEIVRYGPNRYSFSSTLAQKPIYGHGSKFAKSSWYGTWSSPAPSEWSLFSDSNMARHAANRRHYQSAYSLSSLVHYESHVDTCSDIFRQRLRELSGMEAAATDMCHWFQCYAFDVIGLITYSQRLGFLDKGLDVQGVMGALEDHLEYATLVGVYSWLHPVLFKIRNWLAGEGGVGRAYIMKFTQERIQVHQENKDKRGKAKSDQDRILTTEDVGQGFQGTEDFLTKFFRKNAADPHNFTMYHVAMGCVSNMVAGSDTTAISLSAIFYYLLTNRSALSTLRAEVDALDSKFGNITFKQSQDLPYLQAVLKEALRLHPATGLPFERVVPTGGAIICDQFFPAGTIVGINSWVAHRSHAIFGPDANTFKPERWLTCDSEKLALMERNWMPFGLGSRTCIGRHVSHLEICKLVPLLVRDFDFELLAESRDASGEGNRVDEIHWETRNHWFVKPLRFDVRLFERREQRSQGECEGIMMQGGG